jgi:hypothetical protein
MPARSGAHHAPETLQGTSQRMGSRGDIWHLLSGCRGLWVPPSHGEHVPWQPLMTDAPFGRQLGRNMSDWQRQCKPPARLVDSGASIEGWVAVATALRDGMLIHRWDANSPGGPGSRRCWIASRCGWGRRRLHCQSCRRRRGQSCQRRPRSPGWRLGPPAAKEVNTCCQEMRGGASRRQPQCCQLKATAPPEG